MHACRSSPINASPSFGSVTGDASLQMADKSTVRPIHIFEDVYVIIANVIIHIKVSLFLIFPKTKTYVLYLINTWAFIDCQKQGDFQCVKTLLFTF